MKLELQKNLFFQIWKNPVILQDYRNFISEGLLTNKGYSVLLLSLLKFFDEYNMIPTPDQLHHVASEYAKETFPSDGTFASRFHEILSIDYDVEDPFTRDTLVSLMRKRGFEEYQNYVSDLVNQQDYDIDKLLRGILLLDEIEMKTETNIFQMEDSGIAERLQGYQTLFGNVPKLSLPVPALNHYFSGGTYRGVVATLMAPTSFGKTTMLVLFGHHFRKMGWFVLHITIEESMEMICRKYDSVMTGIRLDGQYGDDGFSHSRAIVEGDLIEPTLGGLWVAGLDPCQPIDILSTTRKVKAKMNPQNLVVIVDYADLIHTGEKDPIENSKLAFRNLVRIAKREQIWMWTACQGTRKSAYKRIVKAEDIAEDYTRARLSFYLLTICMTEDEERRNVRRLFIAKNKLGPRYREIPIQIDWRSYALDEIGEQTLKEIMEKDVKLNADTY